MYVPGVAAANLPDPDVIAILSAPRFSTYLAAAGHDQAAALELYAWNAQVSSALMVPAHFAEIASRNAAAEALEAVYGPQWPWAAGTARSLPNPRSGYSPQRDLQRTATRQPTTGKVIAELKFAFWGKLFTARHDQRVWVPRIHSLFPNADPDLSVADLRLRIANDLESIRVLRNRIAHHEPIHTRDLDEDLARMLDLIELRSSSTARWVRAIETSTAVLASRPQVPLVPAEEELLVDEPADEQPDVDTTTP